MSARTSVLLLVMVFAPGALWSQQDPLIGTWKLNLAKSKYFPAAPAQSDVKKYEPLDVDGVKLVRDRVDAKGEQLRNEPTIVFDGKERPVANPQRADVELNRRVNAYTTERILTKGGRIVNFLQRVVSTDGRTLTVRELGIDEQGKPFSYAEVYEKQ